MITETAITIEPFQMKPLQESWFDYCGAYLGRHFGRDDQMDVLFDDFSNLIKQRDLLRVAVYSSYSATDHPTRRADKELWLRLFRMLGYCKDGVPFLVVWSAIYKRFSGETVVLPHFKPDLEPPDGIPPPPPNPLTHSVKPG